MTRETGIQRQSYLGAADRNRGWLTNIGLRNAISTSDDDGSFGDSGRHAELFQVHNNVSGATYLCFGFGVSNNLHSVPGYLGGELERRSRCGRIISVRTHGYRGVAANAGSVSQRTGERVFVRHIWCRHPVCNGLNVEHFECNILSILCESESGRIDDTAESPIRREALCYIHNRKAFGRVSDRHVQSRTECHLICTEHPSDGGGLSKGGLRDAEDKHRQRPSEGQGGNYSQTAFPCKLFTHASRLSMV